MFEYLSATPVHDGVILKILQTPTLWGRKQKWRKSHWTYDLNMSTCNVMKLDETNFSHDATIISYLTPRLMTSTPVKMSRPTNLKELVLSLEVHSLTIIPLGWVGVSMLWVAFQFFCSQDVCWTQLEIWGRSWYTPISDSQSDGGQKWSGEMTHSYH